MDDKGFVQVSSPDFSGLWMSMRLRLLTRVFNEPIGDATCAHNHAADINEEGDEPTVALEFSISGINFRVDGETCVCSEELKALIVALHECSELAKITKWISTSGDVRFIFRWLGDLRNTVGLSVHASVSAGIDNMQFSSEHIMIDRDIALKILCAPITETHFSDEDFRDLEEALRKSCEHDSN